MSSSWSKRHSHEKDTSAIRRKRVRYEAWKSSWQVSKKKWKEIPLKAGDSWNPRIGCWNNEVYRGERHPEGHAKQGELTEKGKALASCRSIQDRNFHSANKGALQPVNAEG